MARLSTQLGLRVVVEGVETEDQLELLTPEESIDEVQGYLLCRPLPAADLRKLLQRKPAFFVVLACCWSQHTIGNVFRI
jgi:EAL domain-containing protein (putative c-di-GMP-specific phosphodiesterase class I)